MYAVALLGLFYSQMLELSMHVGKTTKTGTKEIFSRKKNLGQFWIRDWELVKPCGEQLILKRFLPLVPAIPVNQGLSVKK